MTATTDPTQAAEVRRLIEWLRRSDVRLAARDGVLHYDAPAGVMTPAMMAALARHKMAILALLSEPSSPAEGPETDVPSAPVPVPSPVPLSPNLRSMCFEVARTHGFPRLPLPHLPAEAVAAGPVAWGAFAAVSPTVDLLFALDAMADLAAVTPVPQASAPRSTTRINHDRHGGIPDVLGEIEP